MDFRWAGGDINRIRALAQELVGLQPDIIVTMGTAAAVALQQETRTIPIVFVGVGDPVVSGLVATLNQPGGNITGFAIYEASLGGKWLELLSEIAPGLKRVAIMFNPDTSTASRFLPSLEAESGRPPEAARDAGQEEAACRHCAELLLIEGRRGWRVNERPSARCGHSAVARGGHHLMPGELPQFLQLRRSLGDPCFLPTPRR
jgi:hypothetical protein